jgi:hypothetical protein
MMFNHTLDPFERGHDDEVVAVFGLSEVDLDGQVIVILDEYCNSKTGHFLHNTRDILDHEFHPDFLQNWHQLIFFQNGRILINNRTGLGGGGSFPQVNFYHLSSTIMWYGYDLQFGQRPMLHTINLQIKYKHTV